MDLVLRSSSPRKNRSLLGDPLSPISTRTLSIGSKFTVAYAVEAKLKSGFRRGGVSSNLGVLEVDWSPVALGVPKEVSSSSRTTVGSIESHGPLILQSPSTMRFRAPACYIESAPFEVELTIVPPTPSVAAPFQVLCSITNKTHLHQLLTIQLHTPALTDGAPREGLLLSGTTRGELTLGPQESQTLQYTFLASHPGPLRLPALQIASTRYKSWVVHEGGGGGARHDVYVLP